MYPNSHTSGLKMRSACKKIKEEGGRGKKKKKKKIDTRMSLSK
jgi:hypothetical protein